MPAVARVAGFGAVFAAAGFLPLPAPVLLAVLLFARRDQLKLLENV